MIERQAQPPEPHHVAGAAEAFFNDAVANALKLAVEYEIVGGLVVKLSRETTAERWSYQGPLLYTLTGVGPKLARVVADSVEAPAALKKLLVDFSREAAREKGGRCWFVDCDVLAPVERGETGHTAMTKIDLETRRWFLLETESELYLRHGDLQVVMQENLIAPLKSAGRGDIRTIVDAYDVVPQHKTLLQSALTDYLAEIREAVTLGAVKEEDWPG